MKRAKLPSHWLSVIVRPVMCWVDVRWRLFMTRKVWKSTCAGSRIYSDRVLIDKFLERAAEFDVDALADETACVMPASRNTSRKREFHRATPPACCPRFASTRAPETMRHYTRKLARALSVTGLMNIQFALQTIVCMCWK